MMNDLLRDLVVEEKVAVFIDDVMVATEIEEGHDEIVDVTTLSLSSGCN